MFGRMANIACCSRLSRCRVARCSRGVSHADWVGVTLTWRTRSRVRPSMPPRILRASHHLQAGQGLGFRAIQVPQRLPCAALRLCNKVDCGLSAALPVVCVVGSEHQQQREREGGQHKGLLQAPVQKLRWVAVSHLVRPNARQAALLQWLLLPKCIQMDGRPSP